MLPVPTYSSDAGPSTGRPITLSCGVALQRPVGALADALGSRGFDVDIVVGREAKGALLQRLEEADDDGAMHVVCVPSNLHPSRIEILRRSLVGRIAGTLVLIVTVDPEVEP